jgi:hypothetical protein
MRRFLNRLLRDFRTTSTARGSRGAPRRAALQVEGLEDRLVMSSSVGLQQLGPTLFIDVPQNQHILLESTGFSNGFRGLKVYDNGTLVNNPDDFSIDASTAVNITVTGGDSVVVNDSNGMPFAQHTAINLLGSGSNTLTLEGSRGVAGNETYVAGGAPWTPGEALLDNLTFTFNAAIAKVTDTIAITGTLDVQTSGTNVVLSGSNGSTQTLSGMDLGGGDTLTYANMPTVDLELYSANAQVTLTATAAAAGEQAFAVLLHGAGDFAIIETTPSGVFTSVSALGSNQGVPLWANSGPVSIAGNQSTTVLLGNPWNGYVTAGIQANVSVTGVEFLTVSNSGNTATDETVTVTESTISGSGLFGNDAVTVSYSNVGEVTILSGQLVDWYTVIASQPGAEFTSDIDIVDNSSYYFVANVFVDSGSDLNLQLNNNTLLVPAPAYLNVFIAPGGTSAQDGEGDVYVSFPNGSFNEVNQVGFSVAVGNT